MDVLPAHLNRDSFRDSFKGFVALEIIIDLPLGFPINNIISLFGDLTIDANSQTAVASQLRRHIHDVIIAGDGPGVLFTSEHVIPVLIEHKLLASTLRACGSMSTQKWDGRSERLTENIYANLTSKVCWLSLWLQTSKKSKRHPGQMPRLLLAKGIRLYLRESVRCGMVKAKNGVIGICCRAGLETLRAL